MTHKRYEINGLSLVVLHPKDGPNAIGFLNLAEEYLRAAEKLIPDERSFVPTAESPASLLTGRTLELLLKSFLLACGIPVEDLKRKIGHELKKCLEKAEQKGIGKIASISPSLRCSVALLSNEYSGKHLEYFLGPGRGIRPDLRQLLPEIRKVHEALEEVYRDGLNRHP